MTSITKFLSAYFPGENEPVHLRFFKPRGAEETNHNRPEKLTTTRAAIATDKAIQQRLKALNQTRGVYFVVNAGGDKDTDIGRFNACFVESDTKPLEEQHAALDRAPLLPSIRNNTKKSVHAYWLIKGDCTAEQWREVQRRLIAFFDGDKSIKNPSRVMRLPGFDHISADDSRKRVECVSFNPSQRYTVAELLAAFPPVPKEEREALHRQNLNGTVETADIITEGNRNVTLTSLAGTMRRPGMSADEIETALQAVNERRCCPPLSTEEVRSIAISVSRYAPESASGLNAALNSSTSSISSDEAIKWPEIDEAAFYGLAGDLVRAIEPHTEADPIALLLQFLTTYGNAVGRSAHIRAEADKHYANLFMVAVGNTSKGRKGTSWGQTKNLFGSADDEWLANCLASGLSSGEGLIWAVRDPIEKVEPIKEKGRIVDYQTVKVDLGIADKRLLVVESEFASVLKVAVREGNTLTAVIREAWDTGNFRSLTKNSPAKTTGAHVSIIGHITRDELRRYMENTEAANGFANRFLWLCVKRSKSLPDGGQIQTVDFGDLSRRLFSAVSFGKKAIEMRRNEQAGQLWRDVYDDLSEGKPGLLGAVIARAEAQVMRLAMIYALLDSSEMIKRVHLEAALAVWQYAEDSARYIFGDHMGDPVADTILLGLKEVGNEGLTRTDLNRLFNRNVNSAAINRALTSLYENGRANYRKEKPESGTGRHVERWFALNAITKETKKTKKVAPQSERHPEIEEKGDLNSLNSFLSSPELSESNQGQPSIEVREWVY
jgi:hypothetical protein